MQWLFELFHTLFTYPIFNVLMELYALIGDMSLAIVMLTTLVFIITFPLTWKRLKSVQAIQSLQPEMNRLRAEHSGDLAAFTTAQYALYKQHGIATGPGLSAIVQMMVFSGLFFALNSVLQTVTLSRLNELMYPFLTHFSTLPNMNVAWLTLIHSGWHFSLTAVDPFHVLPVLTGMLTFIQMRMAQPVDVSQVKIVMQFVQFILPLFMVGVTVFFALQFASGVTLYRLTWLFLSVVQQYFAGGWGSLWQLPRFSLANQPSNSQTHASTPTKLQSGKRQRGRRKKRR